MRTPNLDALAANGVRFARHYSQAAPCAPGRAALHTGTYQMNNRVVANGTPLDARFDNVAHMARRAGYVPALFGYTDTGVDPRTVADRSDPRLSTYEGILPGFDVVMNLDSSHGRWIAWLRTRGYDGPDGEEALATEHERPEDLSESTFLTDSYLAWLDRRDGPWFAHLSYLRPHPPYSAAGRFATMYDPDDCPDPVPSAPRRHPLHDSFLAQGRAKAPSDLGAVRAIRAQYYGMISEVDAQLGRIWDDLRRRGMWEDTVVVVTADHGEQLGDQGLLGKLGFFEASYHVPAIVRDPRSPAAHGSVVEQFTENVDILPTLCEALGQPVPLQCDGRPLTPFVQGQVPAHWRDAAFYEWDWRDEFIERRPHEWPHDRRLERRNLAVRRSAERAYVQFGDGSWRCFDLVADAGWWIEITDPTTVLADAQAMLVWRSRHADRTLTGMLLEDGGIGRWPD